MKLFTKIIIICIFTNLYLKTAKAQLTYIGSNYSLTNTNTDWNAKFTRGVINTGNANSWQSFFQSPASYSSVQQKRFVGMQIVCLAGQLFRLNIPSTMEQLGYL